MAKTFKKDVVTMLEIASEVMNKCPGHYKNLASANATVRATARALGINDINGKGKHKRIAAVNAEEILKAIVEKCGNRKTATPIEKAAKEAEKEKLKAQLDANLEKIKENEKKLRAGKPQTATEKKAEADAFELRRKHFYTDVNYFIKLATTPAERIAIWEALGKLYGLRIEKPADCFDASRAAKNPTGSAYDLPNFSI